MLKLAEWTGQPLKWIQPRTMKMEYELRSDDFVAARLDFRSSWGSFATAASADGTWTFKRVGFWQTRVTIRAEGSDKELATFHNNTWSGGGTLQFPDGRKFPASTNFWTTQYEFKTETGEPIVSFRKIGGLLHMSADVDIHPLARSIPEMPWMVMLGWYLAVMMYMDSSSATVAMIPAM